MAEIYKDVLEDWTGYNVELIEPDSSDGLSGIMGNATQIKYDRTYDRVFDNTKLLGVCGEGLDFVSMKDGLKQCLSDYLNLPVNQRINKHNPYVYAWLDKSTGKKCSSRDMESSKDKMKYFGYYYALHLMASLKKTIRIIKKHLGVCETQKK